MRRTDGTGAAGSADGAGSAAAAAAANASAATAPCASRLVTRRSLSRARARERARRRDASLRRVRSALRRLAKLPGVLACTVAATALAQTPAGAPVCPAIAEGFTMCANDLLSGNCDQFVAAATELAQLYQIQVAETPAQAGMLLATNWWGCGDALLGDMKQLLLRLGTPAARALLQQEPFARLVAPGAGAPPPPAPPPPSADCANQPGPDAQVACASAQEAAARAAYRSALASCRSAVAEPLREALAGSEAAWEESLPGQCDAAAFEYDDPKLQTFARASCFAQAYSERVSGMRLAHPECGA